MPFFFSLTPFWNYSNCSRFLFTYFMVYYMQLPHWKFDFALLHILISDRLCFQVGDFYEAIGIDACILVEYAGLNPFGGLRSDSVPRAGCPVIVLYFLPSIIYLAFLSQFLLSIMGAVQDISILCCYILVNRIILCVYLFFVWLITHLVLSHS